MNVYTTQTTRFQFACPTGVGGRWFTHAAKMAGFKSDHPFRSNRPFDNEVDMLRVGLIRNPYDWLLEVWGDPRCYLENYSGEMTRLALSYEADTVLRIEDCPGAAVDLFWLLGAYNGVLDLPFFRAPVGIPNNRDRWGQQEMTAVRKVDRELFDRYDYW